MSLSRQASKSKYHVGLTARSFSGLGRKRMETWARRLVSIFLSFAELELVGLSTTLNLSSPAHWRLPSADSAA